MASFHAARGLESERRRALLRSASGSAEFKSSGAALEQLSPEHRRCLRGEDGLALSLSDATLEDALRGDMEALSLLRLGLLIREGSVQRVEASLSAALETEPSAAGYLEKGLLRVRYDDLDAAVEALEMAHRLEPQDELITLYWMAFRARRGEPTSVLRQLWPEIPLQSPTLLELGWAFSRSDGLARHAWRAAAVASHRFFASRGDGVALRRLLEWLSMHPSTWHTAQARAEGGTGRSLERERAALSWRMGDADAAIGKLEALLAEQPYDFSLRERLAQYQAALGDVSAERTTRAKLLADARQLSHRLSDDPVLASLVVKYSMRWALTEPKLLSEAKELAWFVVSLCDSRAAWFQLGRLYAFDSKAAGAAVQAEKSEARQAFLAAARDLRERVEAQPELSMLWVWLAELELDWLQDPEQALNSAQRAVAEMPDAWIAHFTLGRVHESLGDVDAARSSMMEALRLAPSETAARRRLVELAALRPNEQQRWLGEIVLLAPESAFERERLTGLLAQSGQWQAWLPLMLEPLGWPGLDRESVRAARQRLWSAGMQNCAMLVALLGEWPFARSSPPVVALVAEFWIRQGEERRALEQARGLEPEDGELYWSLGEVAVRQGEFEQAARWARLALRSGVSEGTMEVLGRFAEQAKVNDIVSCLACLRTAGADCVNGDCIRSLSGTDLSTAVIPSECREDACPSLAYCCEAAQSCLRLLD
jgi:tetratricopeptide (TPR) repeat protein